MKKSVIVNSLKKTFGTSSVLFNSFSYTFDSDCFWVVKGKNGSGKSSFLKLLTGLLHMDEGNVEYEIFPHKVETINFYKHIVLCAPYVELPNVFSVYSFFDWIYNLTPTYLSPTQIIKTFELSEIAQKDLKSLSSGMYQRIKLICTFMMERDFIFLDEPCMNFDTHGFDLYYKLINSFLNNRFLMIASNDEREFKFVHSSLYIRGNCLEVLK